MAVNNENIDKGVGVLGKLLSLIKKYGFWGVIKGLILLLITGYVVFFALNPTYLLEKIEEIKVEKHEESVAKRLSSDQQIREILNRMLNILHADRTWLIEFHNGSSNLVSGLPFLFGSMRIEETRPGIQNVDEEYADFSLSKYAFLSDVISKGYYYGNVDSIQNIDERMYYKFRSNDVQNIALIALYFGERPLGILGVSFCNDASVDWELVGHVIRQNSVKIATLLT